MGEVTQKLPQGLIAEALAVYCAKLEKRGWFLPSYFVLIFL